MRARLSRGHVAVHGRRHRLAQLEQSCGAAVVARQGERRIVGDIMFGEHVGKKIERTVIVCRQLHLDEEQRGARRRPPDRRSPKRLFWQDCQRLRIDVLDGGNIVFNLAEGIKGAPLSERALQLGQTLGIFLIIALAGFAFYNDIVRMLGS